MGLDPDQIAADWLATNPPTGAPSGTGTAPEMPGVVDPLKVFAQSFAAVLHTEPEQAQRVVVEMRAAAFVAGAKDGVDHLADQGVEIPDEPLFRLVLGVDWDNWEPGHIPAADLLEGTGLRDLLDQAGVDIRGIADTTKDRIATALEQGVRQGTGTREIAQDIDQILHDPKRAMMIARTEINRAMTVASVESYARSGMTEFDLLAEATACPICTAIADANPHPLADIADHPPIHPNCRCAVAPVAEDA